jgi:hypothetical protein
MAELAIIGSLVQAVGSIASGMAANDAAQKEAAQMEERGKEEFAASQREAQERRKEGELINSRTQALAAASGAGADAPTIVRLMTDTAGEAEYNAQTDLYGGKQRRAGLRDSAAARRAEGQASLMGSFFDAAGTAIGGTSKFGTAKGWW